MTGRHGLRVNYLLEDTALFGGVKVVLHHANLLHRRGHRVLVLSRGSVPTWYPLRTQFATVHEFTADTVPEADIHVATFWTTIAPAAALPTGQAVHFCQGFEAGLSHNRTEHGQILDAYRAPIPAFAVSPHLAELVRGRFGRPARVLRPAVERWWRPRPRRRPRRPPRVLVPSPFENYVKGVPIALEAITHLRSHGVELKLVRISQWPLTDGERALALPDEFHHHLPPRDVARIVAGCDLLLAPSSDQEGFGLWVLEAMASGVPVVASDIAAHRGFAGDAVELVPVGQPLPLAEAAHAVLRDRRRWRRLRRAGLRRARRFAERPTADELERALRWAADGSWRRPA